MSAPRRPSRRTPARRVTPRLRTPPLGLALVVSGVAAAAIVLAYGSTRPRLAEPIREQSPAARHTVEVRVLLLR